MPYGIASGIAGFQLHCSTQVRKCRPSPADPLLNISWHCLNGVVLHGQTIVLKNDLDYTQIIRNLLLFSAKLPAAAQMLYYMSLVGWSLGSRDDYKFSEMIGQKPSITTLSLNLIGHPYIALKRLSV